MSSPRPTDREILGEIDDPVVRRMAVGAFHIRRYLPFYILGLVWLLSLALLPSIQKDRGTSVAGGANLSSSSGDLSSNQQQLAANDVGSTVGADDIDSSTIDVKPGAPAARGSVARSSASAQQSAAAAKVASGTARSGVACKPGVQQIPMSTYAVQCVAKFTGNNGGATYRGVSADKIRIVRREFPDTANSQAAEEIGKQAGAADEDVAKAIRDEFIKYFNKSFELYGRTVEWVDYESENGNSTEEAQSRGREGACADATKIEKELKAFAVASGSGPFSECAAERKTVVFGAAAYFPERFYRKYHPYLWNAIMECERISYQVGEYIGKRLMNRKAKWAGDPLFQQQNRKFGTYVPDNDEYQHCVKLSEDVITKQYNGPKPTRYDYQLDLSRFPDQAAQGIVQFKAAGVTTIVNACDPFSTLFLTQSAQSQNYFPEWYIIGVALQDVDNVARLFDQNQVNGHLFGMSQLGPTKLIIGKNSEPGRVYKAITGKDIADGTDGGYFGLTYLYNLLQSAGPNLTPESIAAGALAMAPTGAPTYPIGYWSFQDGPDGTKGAGDHTSLDDGREIYWVSEPGTSTTPMTPAQDPYFNGDDGNNGTYKETYNGKRFRNGEWPAEEPPVYPKR